MSKQIYITDEALEKLKQVCKEDNRPQTDEIEWLVERRLEELRQAKTN